jgi:hypothetical protein
MRTEHGEIGNSKQIKRIHSIDCIIFVLKMGGGPKITITYIPSEKVVVFMIPCYQVCALFKSVHLHIQLVQETFLMDPPLTTGEDPLLNATKSALEHSTNSTLQEFCLKYNLVAAASGRRGQCVKGDYVACILSYVSNLLKG